MSKQSSSHIISEGVGGGVTLLSPVIVSLLEYFEFAEVRARQVAFFVSWAHVNFGDGDSDDELGHDAMSMFRSYEEMFASELDKFVDQHDFTEDEVIEVLYKFNDDSSNSRDDEKQEDDEKDEAEAEEAKQVITLLLACLDPKVFWAVACKERRVTLRAQEDAEYF